MTNKRMRRRSCDDPALFARLAHQRYLHAMRLVPYMPLADRLRIAECIERVAFANDAEKASA